VVTDLAEVFRLGTEKAKENLAFRRYLAEHHTPETPFQIVASEVQRHIDCTACANCCRNSQVALSAADIDRIATYLGTTPDAVTRHYTDPDPDAPSSRILRTTGSACVFLDGNLCRIYAARPKPCRDFPHVAPGDHSLGGRPSSHARWAPLCPIIYNALEDYKHRTGFHLHRHRHAG